jgi:poly-gamma-glutamate synthesis protein (capsule biosynthesis protein)
MVCTLAFAGDTMLGRGVAQRLVAEGPRSLIAPEVREITADADLFVLNLECCISERGQPWPDPAKRFFFRAPPVAVETLTWLGVSAVTLANNHALDFGQDALLDTLDHLAQAGIHTVGAGADQATARASVVLPAGEVRVGLLGITDHPRAFAAQPDRPGVAYADLRHDTPAWLPPAIEALRAGADLTLVSPHWGPNMVDAPISDVRAAAQWLRSIGADLVAGHSAHVFHGVAGAVCYDLGDFIDDYAVHPRLRNDLGLLFLITLDRHGPVALQAVPLALDYCHTRLARGDEHARICARFIRACRELGTDVHTADGRLTVPMR